MNIFPLTHNTRQLYINIYIHNTLDSRCKKWPRFDWPNRRVVDGGEIFDRRTEPAVTRIRCYRARGLVELTKHSSTFNALRKLGNMLQIFKSLHKTFRISLHVGVCERLHVMSSKSKCLPILIQVPRNADFHNTVTILCSIIRVWI